MSYGVKDNNASISFYKEDGSLKMKSKHNGDWFRMADQKEGKIVKDSAQHFQYLTLHTINGLQFVIPKPAQKGEVKTIRGEKDNKKFDVIVFDLTSNNETKRVELKGGAFNTEGKKEFSLGGLNYRTWYGAKQIIIPFGVKLNDFQLEKYPGSDSPASYASEVTLVDGKESYDFRIFMNNILSHKGFKFFQSSFDNEGEEIEQTHLSVNHDFWGTLVSYIGYSMLYFGLICILFAKNTRFDYLKNSLRKIRKKKLTMSLIGFLFFFGSSFAQDDHNHDHEEEHVHKTEQQNITPHKIVRITDKQVDSILQANIVDKRHAESFGKLVIQDANGRMKPAHTFASELVRKVAQSESFKGMTPSQVCYQLLKTLVFG